VKFGFFMVEVFFLAIALSMDAFAVSIGLGSKQKDKAGQLAILVAIYFGLFQGLMPILGYLGGKSVFGWVEAYANWVAFILLILIGGKMIYESFSDKEDNAPKTITHRLLLVLAIATSIDALAAGFALNLLKVNPYLSCAFIALTTWVFSFVGVFAGSKSRAKLESKAEILGGLVLIALGFKILLF